MRLTDHSVCRYQRASASCFLNLCLNSLSAPIDVLLDDRHCLMRCKHGCVEHKMRLRPWGILARYHGPPGRQREAVNIGTAVLNAVAVLALIGTDGFNLQQWFLRVSSDPSPPFAAFMHRVDAIGDDQAVIPEIGCRQGAGDDIAG